MDIFLFLLISIIIHSRPASTISINSRNLRSSSNRPPDNLNWVTGLKEATYQALVREQNHQNHHQPQLKSAIYTSIIENQSQNSVTPFGDIAIIARGQLYTTSLGYKFVQDVLSTQNDCDCHNLSSFRCQTSCQQQQSHNLENLIALWSVKRIRHRDAKIGHRYELQYTISPMNAAINAQFVARNGRFDYNVPGHVFIVQINNNEQQIQQNFNRFDKESPLKILPLPYRTNSKPINSQKIPEHYNIYNPIKSETTNHYQHNTPPNSNLNTGEFYHHQTQKPPQTTPSDHIFNPGFLIGISPNGYKHIVHDLPDLIIERHQNNHQNHATKQPVKHYHHHFYIPEVEDIDYDKKQQINHDFNGFNKQTTTTRNQEAFLTNNGFQTSLPIDYDKKQQINHGFNKESQSFLTSNGFETSHPTIDYNKKQQINHSFNKQTPTTTQNQDLFLTQNGFQTTLAYPTTASQFLTGFKPSVPIQEQPKYYLTTTRQQQEDATQVIPPITNTYRYDIPITVNPTIFTQADVKFPSINSERHFYNTGTTPSSSSSFNPSPFFIQYSEPDPIYHSNQPTYSNQPTILPQQPTIPTFITIQQPQQYDETTHPTLLYSDDNTDSITFIQSTTPMSPTTIANNKQKQKFPDSINAQLPAPDDKSIDTTIPYVASTAVSIIKTDATTIENQSEEKTAQSTQHSNSFEEKSTTIPIDKTTTTSSPTTIRRTKPTNKYQIKSKQTKTTKRIPKPTTTINNDLTTTQTDDTTIATTTTRTTTRKEQFKTRKLKTTTIKPKSISSEDLTTIQTEDTTIATTTTKKLTNLHEELFKTRKQHKTTTRPKTITSENFDLFGDATRKTTQQPPASTTQQNLSTKNAFDEIFSEFNQQHDNNNRLLAPFTQLNLNASEALKNARISKYLKYKRNKTNKFTNNKETTTTATATDDNKNLETKTSQSFITSISFKVNKKSSETNDERLTKGELDELQLQNENDQLMTTTEENNHQTFDDIAQTLVNHARIVSLL